MLHALIKTAIVGIASDVEMRHMLEWNTSWCILMKISSLLVQAMLLLQIGVVFNLLANMEHQVQPVMMGAIASFMVSHVNMMRTRKGA